MAAFTLLLSSKEKLATEGLFDSAVKKKLPRLPQRIGVVTSPTGAAVRDIVTTVSRRYPLAEILIVPVLVQGPDAPGQIAAALSFINSVPGVDVIIVGRGGGSIEELWAGNVEIVARAILLPSCRFFRRPPTKRILPLQILLPMYGRPPRRQQPNWLSLTAVKFAIFWIRRKNVW